MAEPILVIHGVANRDQAQFEASVAALQQALGDAWELLPVYWGDLGGVGTDITDCLPLFQAGEWGVRAGREETETLPLLPLPPIAFGEGKHSNAERAVLIAAAATTGGELVRGVVTGQQVQQAAQQELPTTKVLQFLDDEAVFQHLGEAIRAAMEGADAAVSPPVEEELVRGADPWREELLSEEQVRSLLDPLTKAARRVIHSVDEILGRTLSNQLGQWNQQLRSRIMPPLSEFFGDIIVYQRNPARIQQRVWEALAKHGESYGTAAKPVHVVAHSLGGVITFDMAVQETNPLWIKSFTTFGSQSAFFHIVDQRKPLTAYRKGQPVELPATIGKWINLWDTADLLAFTASTVFRLWDGTLPKDIPLRNLFSLILEEKGWMHSTYWHEAVNTNPTALIKAIREAVAG